MDTGLTNNHLGTAADLGGGWPPTPTLILRSLPSMTQMPTPPPISDSSSGPRFRAVNNTHEQVPGSDPAPEMDDIPAIRGGGQARGGQGHRADAGPELTRRAVGPRLYHKKSRMGCLRCKARRVKVSYVFYAMHISILRPSTGWGVSPSRTGVIIYARLMIRLETMLTCFFFSLADPSLIFTLL